MSFLSKIKHPTLTEKPMEIKIVLKQLEVKLAADQLTVNEKNEMAGNSLFVQWKRGNLKQNSKPYAFSLDSGTLHGTTGLTVLDYDLDDQLGTVSGLRWSKKGEPYPKKSEFKVFLQSEAVGGKNLSKKGGLVLAESDFDLSPYQDDQKQHEVTVSFPKKTKGAGASFTFNLTVDVQLTHTDKEVDSKQLETRAESLRLDATDSEALSRLLAKQKNLPDLQNFTERKITYSTDKYAQEKAQIIKEDDEMDDLFEGDGGAPNSDYSQPFQDYKVECRIAKMACSFLVKDRTLEEAVEMPVYHVQPANQLLRTDQRLRAMKTEAEAEQTTVARSL